MNNYIIYIKNIIMCDQIVDFTKSIEFDLEGKFTFLDKKTDDNKTFFRKHLYGSSENFPNHEQKICEILKKNKHPNIVDIYEVNNKYIDIELVQPIIKLTDKIKYKMNDVAKFLRKLGIAYIDWKDDNIGIGIDGEPKLFDFNCSGIFDTKNNIWISEPPECYMYRNLKKHNNKSIIYIDEIAFSKGLK